MVMQPTGALSLRVAVAIVVCFGEFTYMYEYATPEFCANDPKKCGIKYPSGNIPITCTHGLFAKNGIPVSCAPCGEINISILFKEIHTMLF